ncbi:MAG: arginine repressor [Clostridia bacterium]
MARSLRQSKILEVIMTNEVKTQDELVTFLKNAGFEITQATISRDIKELGLTKTLSSDSKSYKYSFIDNGEQTISSKHVNIFKEMVISVKSACNLSVIKTIKGMASSVCGLIDKLNLQNVMGAVFGDDTVMIILPSSSMAEETTKTIESIIEN